MEYYRVSRNKPTHVQSTTFDKGFKSTRCGKNNLFNKQYWKKCIFMCKRKKLNPYLALYTKINSKRFKDTNIRPKIVKLLEDNQVKTSWRGFGSYFLDRTPKAEIIKAKNRQVRLNQLKAFAQQKRQLTEWKENLQNGKKNICKPYIQ